MIYCGWNENLAKAIADKSGSSQFKEDVGFMRRIAYFGGNVRSYYFDDVAVCVGYRARGGQEYRIVGIGVSKTEQSKGVGSTLLRAVEITESKAGVKEIYTKTKVAGEWYAVRGYDCEGINGKGEFIMRKKLNG